MEDKNLIRIQYVKLFLEQDYNKAIYYCQRWALGYGRNFTAKKPEDLLYEIIENIIDPNKNWECYLKSYIHFRNSVYYHLKNALKNYFCSDKNKEITSISDETEKTFNGELIDHGDIKIYEQIDYQEMIDRIKQRLENENRIEEYFSFELLLEDYRREDIAEKLNLPQSEITNIKKRLQRIVVKEIKQIKSQERK